MKSEKPPMISGFSLSRMDSCVLEVKNFLRAFFLVRIFFSLIGQLTQAFLIRDEILKHQFLHIDALEPLCDIRDSIASDTFVKKLPLDINKLDSQTERKTATELYELTREATENWGVFERVATGELDSLVHVHIDSHQGIITEPYTS